MNKEKILGLIEECDFLPNADDTYLCHLVDLEDFANRIRTATLEEAARVCEIRTGINPVSAAIGWSCANFLREMKK